MSSRVTRYERETSEPDFKTAGKMARELGVPLAYLLVDNDVLTDIILAVARMPAAEQKRLATKLKGQGED